MLFIACKSQEVNTFKTAFNNGRQIIRDKKTQTEYEKEKQSRPTLTYEQFCKEKEDAKKK